jgi:hypothetical protein
VTTLPEDIDVRLARVEEMVKMILQSIGKIEKNDYTERILKLENQMAVIKWLGGAAWAVALILIGVLAKEVM